MAILLPCSWLSTLLSMVVFPLPRKPVKICKQHTGAQAKAESTDAEGLAVLQSGPAGVLIAETCEDQECMESWIGKCTTLLCAAGRAYDMIYPKSHQD